MHAYYESHKQEIMSDLFTFGRTPTRKKWSISSSTLYSLERRWLTEEQKAKLDNMTFAPSTNVHLPQFPEFSSSWEPQVQLKWLEIYETLSRRAEVAKQEK